jgi:hypothetical protein
MQAQVMEVEQDEALSRHQRKCVICHHPDRDEIEEEFIHWGIVWQMSKDYGIDDYRSIYRHARATGLLERRRANFRSALDQIIEQAAGAKVTGDTVIRAIRAYSCLDKEGRWAEPPTQVVFTVVRTGPSQTTVTTSSSRTAAPKVAVQPAPSPPPPPPPVPLEPAAKIKTPPVESEAPRPSAASEPPLDEPCPAHLPPPPPRVEERPHALVAAAAASAPTRSGSQPRTLIYGTGIRNHANSLKT